MSLLSVTLAGRAARWLTDLDPSSPDARRWLTDELAKPDYEDTRTILQRIADWLYERLLGVTPTVPRISGDETSLVWLGIVVALIIGVIILILSRVRAERVVVEQDRSVLGGLDLSADEFRERGAAALREGRWNDAVIEYTRAVAREAADRTLLSDAPSLTAHEIGGQLTQVFPVHADPVRAGMDRFDAVRYGEYAAAEADARATAELDTTLRRAKPELSAVGAPAGWQAPGSEVAP